MADYADLTQINTLHMQLQQVAQAIDNLDAGGSPTSVTIGPPPSQPLSDPMSIPAYGSMVSIAIPSPASSEFTAALRTKLVEIEADLAQELAALGVTSTPPAHT